MNSVSFAGGIESVSALPRKVQLDQITRDPASSLPNATRDYDLIIFSAHKISLIKGLGPPANKEKKAQQISQTSLS